MRLQIKNVNHLGMQYFIVIFVARNGKNIFYITTIYY